MLVRILQPTVTYSFFLLGARGTGKSTLIKSQFSLTNSIYINLLLPQEEEKYSRNPELLLAEIKALPVQTTHIIIDEIQKIPKLLDVIHELIETENKIFVLTGSSARKLKHGGANLLAGRAFVYHLYPFSFLELGTEFNLENALQWGLLPKVTQLETEEEKVQFLQAYAYTYVKEEIWVEQLVRKLDPFRRFLEVAAQCNGKIINYDNISRDVGVDDKTIKNYFSILEDTLLGFFLEPFHHSFRKRLSLKPKFYFFDLGVVRTLARHLSVPILSSTSVYGDYFEHFIILECFKLASYYFSEFRFSYLRTKDDAEIDLIVERPGQKILFIEIKSSTNVLEKDLTQIVQLSNDFANCESVCFSRDARAKQFNNITVYPWRDGIQRYFVKK